MDAATKSESTELHSALRYKFIALAGNEHVRPATAADAVAGVQPKLVIEPGTEKELAEELRLANEAGLGVIPRGGGTKLEWGNSPARAGLILSTARLNEIIEHAWADLTVTVEAGCTIQRLQETLAQHGHRLALDPLWPEKTTIRGVLSTNDTGGLRLRFGALRVLPLPRNTVSLSIPTSHVDETQRFVHADQDTKLAHADLQSRFSGETQPISDILFEGTEVGLAAQETQLRNLSGLPSLSKTPASVWTARQDLWGFPDPECTAIAKVTILPANLARMIGLFERTANASQLRWRALIYATGIG